MGKKNKAKATTKTPNLSSGKRRGVRIKRNIRRAKMKVARWKRYATDEVSVSTNNENRSRFSWDTTKLEKHIAHLENLL